MNGGGTSCGGLSQQALFGVRLTELVLFGISSRESCCSPVSNKPEIEAEGEILLLPSADAELITFDAKIVKLH